MELNFSVLFFLAPPFISEFKLGSVAQWSVRGTGIGAGGWGGGGESTDATFFLGPALPRHGKALQSENWMEKAAFICHSQVPMTNVPPQTGLVSKLMGTMRTLVGLKIVVSIHVPFKVIFLCKSLSTYRAEVGKFVQVHQFLVSFQATRGGKWRVAVFAQQDLGWQRTLLGWDWHDASSSSRPSSDRLIWVRSPYWQW